MSGDGTPSGLVLRCSATRDGAALNAVVVRALSEYLGIGRCPLAPARGDCHA